MPRIAALLFRVIDSRIERLRAPIGAIAQLGERLHGMQEVGGSIPPSSTKRETPITLSLKAF
jgi:hypothetical protein